MSARKFRSRTITATAAIEALDLIARAEREGLVAVTTEKDLARLAGEDDLAALANVARALPVTLAVAEETAFREFVMR